MSSQRKGILRFFCFFLIVLFSSGVLIADEEKSPVNLEIFPEKEALSSQKPFCVAFHFQIEKGWHLTWKNPGTSPVVQIDLPPELSIISEQWSAPNFFSDEEPFIGYEKEATLLVTLSAKEPLAALPPISATVSYVACSDSQCLPETKKVTLSAATADQEAFFVHAKANIPQSVAVIDQKQQNDKMEVQLLLPQKDLVALYFYPETGGREKVTLTEGNEDISTLLLSDSKPGLLTFEKAPSVVINPLPTAQSSPIKPVLSSEKIQASEEVPEPPLSFLTLIIFAFFGGFLFNLMPCVFPVISLKAFQIISMGHLKKKEIVKETLAFSFGVILSFWVLALLLLVLQAYGQNMGWGFQLQQPLFVAVLTAIFFLLALNLFGVFETGLFLLKVTSNQRETFGSAIWSGVLATMAATPCTGPLLGSVLGVALSLHPIYSLLLFTLMGLGMASPYILLAFFPGFQKYLPTPGKWMETFKHLMAFLLMGSALWLFSVFAVETSMGQSLRLLLCLLFLSFGFWAYGRWPHIKFKKIIPIAVIFISGLFIVYALPQEPNIEQPFSIERLQTLQKEGKTVFVDVTAEWCLICKTNNLFLSKSEIKKKFADLGVVTLVADWTKQDVAITEFLASHGRNSVPLFLVYSPNPKARPEILPQILTKGTLFRALEKASSK